jgi:hypothetical protein
MPERETREPAPLRALVEKWEATAGEAPEISGDPFVDVFNQTLLSCARELKAALSASAVSAPTHGRSEAWHE